MKFKLATICLVIGAVFAPIAANAGDSDKNRTEPVTFVKDSVITTKIKSKLAADKPSSLAHIHVDTDSKGMVVLSGKAKTQEEADKAVSIANGTKGVTSVKSEIQVKNAPAPAHAAAPDSDRMHAVAFVKDSEITTKIKAKLAEDKMSSLIHVKVDTDHKGAVVLSGNVKTQEQADKVISIARATEGVTSVKSNIQLKN